MAQQLGLQIDPDWLTEDRAEVIEDKLKTSSGSLVLPTLLEGYEPDLYILPDISIFDIYNYFMSFSNYDHATFRDVEKMEAYSMAKDGYVREVLVAQYLAPHIGYYAIKSNVKQRTQEKDPLTKRKTYSAWIVVAKTDEGRIHSALCMCKGGYVDIDICP